LLSFDVGVCASAGAAEVASGAGVSAPEDSDVVAVLGSLKVPPSILRREPLGTET
jgi:hypothetical protein